MKFFIQIIYRLLDIAFYKFSIIQPLLIDIVNGYFHQDKQALRKFLSNHKEFIGEEIESLPSVLNYEKHIKKAITLVDLLNLDKSLSVIDIGSAYGDTCVTFANNFPHAKIYAFEPIEESFKKLSEKVGSYSNINTFNLALGNPILDFSEIEIHVTANYLSSSLLKINPNHDNTYLNSALQEIKTERVKIVKLDTIFKDINEYFNIVKLDVQGYELEVLKGGENMLQRTNIVIVEMQNHEDYESGIKYYEIDSFLREKNFLLFDIIPSIYVNRKLYEWNAIYVSKNL
ncbi:MAG: FkbM family methyltransferase [Bacteroidia bacterium]|nr:FkbM family methyltransferase [Bacteroidia bacterium]